MAIRKQDRALPQADFGRKDQLPSGSVYGRFMRGNRKVTDIDLEEARKVLGSGSRAERRAAAKLLKKHGAAPPKPAKPPVRTPVKTAGAQPAMKEAAQKQAVAQQPQQT